MDNTTAPQSVIATEVEIHGSIRCCGSLRIDGKLDGELHCNGDAFIGKSATIKGNLTVNSVSIEGAVEGNITAKDRIEMKSTARVSGDIRAKRLSVEDGVTFIGKSEVNPSGSPLATPVAVASTEAETGHDPEAAAATVREYARR